MTGDGLVALGRQIHDTRRANNEALSKGTREEQVSARVQYKSLMNRAADAFGTYH